MRLTLGKYRFEILWLCGLLLTMVFYAKAAPNVEAQAVNCFYHAETNYCFHYPVDCLCDE